MDLNKKNLKIVPGLTQKNIFVYKFCLERAFLIICVHKKSDDVNLGNTRQTPRYDSSPVSSVTNVIRESWWGTAQADIILWLLIYNPVEETTAQ